jgi:tripartite-type tricarboxylate transporter receptor subunit TctC
LTLALAAILPTGFTPLSRAEVYPNRPIRMLVGLAPGGVQDLFARTVADPLARQLGQPVIVENLAGAGTNLATEAVVRAPADGYTLLLVGAPNAINATLYEKLPFDFSRDIAAVAPLATTPEVLLAHPDVPVRTVAELMAYARANPGKLNFASPGNGTGPHLSGELLKMMAGIDLQHIPYRGGTPALTDLLAGRVELMFIAPAVVLGHIQSGRVRALAVSSTSRCAILPDVPSMSQFLPGFESGGFFGVGAPARTPASVVARLNGEINRALARPDLETFFRDAGAFVWRGTQEDLQRRVAAETVKWARVIRYAHLRPA